MRAYKKITGASSNAPRAFFQPENNPGILRSLPADSLANRIEICIGQAKDHLRSREFALAADKCSEVIDGPASSDTQRMEAHLVRGKALVSVGMLPAAAFDFYKVLEIDHDHCEAYGYILQIESDTGLPLTKR